MRYRGENAPMTLRTRHGLAAAAMLMVALACSAPSADGEASAMPAAESAIQLIDHLTPARDSVGPAPAVFSWTPVAGATRYAIGVWDEVETLQWRRDDISEAKIARPDALTLEPGTYFWSITALRGDEPVGESGRAAFVVREP
jgi:hypothetical protein